MLEGLASTVELHFKGYFTRYDGQKAKNGLAKYGKNPFMAIWTSDH